MKAFTISFLSFLFSLTLVGQADFDFYNHHNCQQKTSEVDLLEFSNYDLFNTMCNHNTYSKRTPPRDLSHNREILPKMDSLISSSWDTLENVWKYSGTRSFKYNSLGQINELTQTSSEGNRSKASYQYLPNGKITIHYLWSDDLDTYLPEFKWNITYDIDGNIMLNTSYLYNNNEGEWKNSSKGYYYYNPLGKIDSFIYHRWEERWPGYYDWIPGSHSQFTYDSVGRVKTDIKKIWNKYEELWELSWKQETSYDSIGYQSISYEWEEGSSDWKQKSKVKFVKNHDGNLISQKHYNWDVYYSEWQSEIIYELGYDSNGNNDSMHIVSFTYGNEIFGESILLFEFDLNISKSDMVLPHEQTYSLSEVFVNKPISYAGKRLINGDWISSGKTTYFYSEDDFTATSDLKKNEISILPNPTTEIISITNEGEYDKLTMELINLQGKLVLRQSVTGKNNIKISHLPSGMYIYRLVDLNNAIQSGKIIIE